MPLPKKLDCSQVGDVIVKFFDGFSVKELAKHFEVSRLTITRLIERKTYKDCTNTNIMVNAMGILKYMEKVDAQMAANKRRGRGNKKEVV